MTQPFHKGIPFVISAPSGAGKTSICRQIRMLIPELAYSVSYTTREKRKGEKDGVDYFYISQETFKKMIDESKFLEWAEVYGNYYGTLKDYVSNKIEEGIDCLLDIDINGAKRLKEIFDNGVFVFILPPSAQELRSRLNKRKTEKSEQMNIRTEKALSEIRDFENYQYIVINDDISRAVEELKSIIISERCKMERRRPLVMDMIKAFKLHL